MELRSGRATRFKGTKSGGESQAAARSVNANTASLPPSPLTMLPAELIMKIACELDHRSCLRLARAWRPFLHGYARGLDPWNAQRLALKRACADKPGLFDIILFLRYHDHKSATDCEASCDGCKCFRYVELAVIAVPIYCLGVKADADKYAILVALYDFMLLDSYRRHREYSLLSAPVRITFLDMAAIADAIFDQRRARGIVVGAYPHNLPPFTFSVTHLLHVNDPETRYTTEADIRKVLCHVDLPLVKLELLGFPSRPPIGDNEDSEARYNDETLSIARALAEGNNRLTALTIVPSRATPAIMDAVGHGCHKLTTFCAPARDEPTFTALIRAFARLPAIQTLDMSGSDLNDPARVQTLASAVAASTTLHNLYLPNCSVTNEGVQHLAQALRRNTTLRALALTFNDLIDDTGACALAAALRANPSTAIRNLHLHSTKIGDGGALALAKMLLVNQSVLRLDLRATLVGADGIVALDKAQNLQPLLRYLQQTSPCDSYLVGAEMIVARRDVAWADVWEGWEAMLSNMMIVSESDVERAFDYFIGRKRITINVDREEDEEDDDEDDEDSDDDDDDDGSDEEDDDGSDEEEEDGDSRTLLNVE